MSERDTRGRRSHRPFARVCIPARFSIGFPLPDKRGGGEIPGFNCWAEFFLKGYGWVPVDASEAAKRPDKQTTLMLTLDHVHKDKLTSTAKDTYFACADLKNADGHMYDLDVFMKGPDKDHLKVTEVSVHKKDGAERYSWKQKDGLWKKEPVKQS